MKLTACSQTDAGLVRRSNQDKCFVSVADGLFMVADGMGGHAAGEVASEMAIRGICREVLPGLPGATVAKACDLLVAAVREVNGEIAREAEQHPAWRGMGTTLTILRLHAGQAQLVHVGDSRLYRFRAGGLEQLSEDHSLVKEQLRHGVISEAEAATSNLRHVLLQAVGATPQLEICCKTMPLAERDWFLLCSDGLSDMLGDDRLAELFAATDDPQQLCDLLVEEANAAGGRDNITVVVVPVEQL